ncbi:hypothetical protein [Kitasatospora sp. MBT66]|uniref:hypothetical protein n=1 Tax=Kitasatospora sp. MBT66 TaxID=1444769 RepID=UPI0005B958C9|nr:hypothetical protein [Kitasatospora sp. MBT66]
MTPTKQRGLMGLEVEITRGDPDAPRVVYLPSEELTEAELTMDRLRAYSDQLRQEAASRLGNQSD